MDKTEEKILENMLVNKTKGDLLGKKELQYLKNVVILEQDSYSEGFLFRYTEDDEIFLEGIENKDGTLTITYIL